MSDRKIEFAGGDPHSGDLPNQDSYWACEQPERPPDGLTVFDARCSKCLIGLVAFRQQGRNDLVGWSQSFRTHHAVTVDEALEAVAER